jgi:hypothetical protein
VAIFVDKGSRKEIKFCRVRIDRFTTKDSCTWNITHNTESTAV